MEVVGNTIVAIILQFINVSNQHVVRLKFTQYYVSISLNKAGENFWTKQNKNKKIQISLLPDMAEAINLWSLTLESMQ